MAAALPPGFPKVRGRPNWPAAARITPRGRRNSPRARIPAPFAAQGLRVLLVDDPHSAGVIEAQLTQPELCYVGAQGLRARAAQDRPGWSSPLSRPPAPLPAPQ